MRDYAIETTFDIKFTTRSFSTGSPTQLAGSPVISAYPNNSTTQLTAGITLTVDFDAVTGLNNIRIVATVANGYAAGSNYTLVITTGTVGGVSVVGECVGDFSLEAQSPLRATVAGRTLDVSAAGEAGVDWANVGSPTTTLNLSGTTVKTATDVEADTVDIQARLPAALTGDGNIKADTLRVGGTLQTAGDIMADTNDIQTRLPAALVGGRIDANVGAISGDATAADNEEAFFDGTGYAGTGNIIPTVTNLTNAPTAGDLTATMKASVNTEADTALLDVGLTSTVTGRIDAAITTRATPAQILTTALTEAYAADGAAGTLSQILFALQAFLQERVVSGTTVTSKKLDGSTTAMTFTLDSATVPTSITRAT